MNNSLFKKILFLDDISRTEFWPAKEFFYDMLRMIIKQASGIVVEPSLRKQLKSSQKELNDLAEISWTENYEHLSQNYIDILDKFISEDMLVIGYEISPALIDFLSQKNISWVDFRISPIRFLPDLVIAIRSSIEVINTNLSTISLSRHEVELEAVKIAASFRHNANYQIPSILRPDDNTVFVIGQTPSDASILYNNAFLELSDFQEKIQHIANNKNIIYIPHPSSNPAHIEKEMLFLKTINGNVLISNVPLYDIFCREQKSIFVGISSGALQEAVFFDKDSVTLFQPICDVLYRNETHRKNAFWQIGFSDFLSIDFWQMVLYGHSYHRETTIEKFKQNELRKLHNVWWGYSAIDLRNNNILHESILNNEFKIKQMLHFCLKQPSGDPSDNYNFAGGEYFWNDRIVNFTLDGKIYCNNIEDGQWYLGNSSEQSIIIVWKYGFWIDKASSLDGWNQLSCTNNLGNSFIIYKYHNALLDN